MIFYDNDNIRKFNVFICAFNFVITMRNSLHGYVSTVSIIIFLYNLFASIYNIKAHGKNTYDNICFILDIATLFMIARLFIS